MQTKKTDILANIEGALRARRSCAEIERETARLKSRLQTISDAFRTRRCDLRAAAFVFLITPAGYSDILRLLKPPTSE